MTFIINPHRFGGGAVSWDTYVASLSPWAWLKLDDATTGLVAADSSGNSRPGVYPNGNFGGGSHPVRHSAALVNGSTWGIVTGGGNNNELYGDDYGNAMSGSWTFGMVLKSTSTTAAQYLMGTGSWPMSVSLNFNFVTFASQSGTISLTYDTTGVQANGLAYTSSGWNDGNEHMWFFEYDSVADTISIWKDGTEVATRSRAGTKPTLTSTDIYILRANPIASMGVDEVLFFNKVLTSGEHSTLAGYLL